MPRLTEVLANKNVKFYNRRFVPVYKQAGPQLLKEQITNRKDRDAGEPCMQEVVVLMSCWKERDFNQSLCAKQLESYLKCRAKAMEKKQSKRQLEVGGYEGQIGSHVSAPHINKTMRRFPQPGTKR